MRQPITNLPGSSERKAQAEPAFALPPTKGAVMPDRDLLDSFLIARNRIRGALVAVNERTMITNVGASELLQPGDRRLLWEHVTRDAGGCARASTMLVLSNGVTVTVRSQSVVSQLGAVGAVLHLCVERPGRGTSPTARLPMAEAAESSGEGRPFGPLPHGRMEGAHRR